MQWSPTHSDLPLATFQNVLRAKKGFEKSVTFNKSLAELGQSMTTAKCFEIVNI